MLCAFVGSVVSQMPGIRGQAAPGRGERWMGPFRHARSMVCSRSVSYAIRMIGEHTLRGPSANSRADTSIDHTQ